MRPISITAIVDYRPTTLVAAPHPHRNRKYLVCIARDQFVLHFDDWAPDGRHRPRKHHQHHQRTSTISNKSQRRKIPRRTRTLLINLTRNTSRKLWTESGHLFAWSKHHPSSRDSTNIICRTIKTTFSEERKKPNTLSESDHPDREVFAVIPRRSTGPWTCP